MSGPWTEETCNSQCNLCPNPCPYPASISVTLAGFNLVAPVDWTHFNGTFTLLPNTSLGGLYQYGPDSFGPDENGNTGRTITLTFSGDTCNPGDIQVQISYENGGCFYRFNSVTGDLTLCPASVFLPFGADNCTGDQGATCEVVT